MYVYVFTVYLTTLSGSRRYSVEWYKRRYTENRKGCKTKWEWHNLRYHSSTFLESLRKPRKASVRISGLEPDLNTGPSQYEVEMPTTRK